MIILFEDIFISCLKKLQKFKKIISKMKCVYCGRTDLQDLNEYNQMMHLASCQKKAREKEEKSLKNTKIIPVLTPSQTFNNLFTSNKAKTSKEFFILGPVVIILIFKYLSWKHQFIRKLESFK